MTSKKIGWITGGVLLTASVLAASGKQPKIQHPISFTSAEKEVTSKSKTPAKRQVKALAGADINRSSAMSVDEAQFILQVKNRLCYEAREVTPTEQSNVTHVECQVVAEGKSSLVVYRVDVSHDSITVISGRDCRATGEVPICIEHRF